MVLQSVVVTAMISLGFSLLERLGFDWKRGGIGVVPDVGGDELFVDQLATRSVKAVVDSPDL